jgi:hypothetical protein
MSRIDIGWFESLSDANLPAVRPPGIARRNFLDVPRTRPVRMPSIGASHGDGHFAILLETEAPLIANERQRSGSPRSPKPSSCRKGWWIMLASGKR